MGINQWVYKLYVEFKSEKMRKEYQPGILNILLRLVEQNDASRLGKKGKSKMLVTFESCDEEGIDHLVVGTLEEELRWIEGILDSADDLDAVKRLVVRRRKQYSQNTIKLKAVEDRCRKIDTELSSSPSKNSQKKQD